MVEWVKFMNVKIFIACRDFCIGHTFKYLMHNFPKWSDTLQKSCSICYKTFIVCLRVKPNLIKSAKKQPPEVFYKKGSFKNFAIFTEKHYWKVYYKETPAQVFYYEYCEICKMNSEEVLTYNDVKLNFFPFIELSWINGMFTNNKRLRGKNISAISGRKIPLYLFAVGHISAPDEVKKHSRFGYYVHSFGRNKKQHDLDNINSVLWSITIKEFIGFRVMESGFGVMKSGLCGT